MKIETYSLMRLKVISKLKRAYELGFFYTLNWLLGQLRFRNLKFNFLRFLAIKKVQSKYNILLYADYCDATFRLYYFAGYGFFYSNYLKNYSSKFAFIDVGANKGLYSILAAKNFNCEKVYSFEPIPSTFDYLKRNASLNDISSKCDLHNLAISDKCDEIEILFNPNHSGTASIAESNKKKGSKTVRIQTINYEILESFFSAKTYNYILKVDVEGFEFTVLTEIFKCDFSKFISSIFYEVDEKWESPTRIENFLRKVGFNNFEIIGDGTHYDVLATKEV